MTRRNCILTTSLTTTSTVFTCFAFAAQDARVGKFDATEWEKINGDAGEKVNAIPPDFERLSEADQLLLAEIAAGGMMQLELSRVAAALASSADVKAYALSEIEEQTGLAAKLREVAEAKGAILPVVSPDLMKEATDKLKAVSPPEFDAVYLGASGVDGHMALEKTMKKVQSSADDATLKLVALTALPLIQVHLQAARDEMQDIG